MDRKQYMREYYLKNKDKWPKSCPEYHKKYREENKEYFREYAKEYKKRNRSLLAMRQAERRASTKKQTPPWADADLIKLIYDECPENMSVDHIEPLNGKEVSGLHTPHNMQYLTTSENSSKCNRRVSGKHTYRMCDDGIARRCYI